MKGQLNVRLSSSKIYQISENAVSLKFLFACEFNRKPRELSKISRWKATELRLFLLYIATIILKNSLPDIFFKHFMCLLM